MINLRYFLGQPVDFNGICYIYPPKVKDMTSKKFATYSYLLTMSQEELEDLYTENGIENPPPIYDYLLASAYNSEEVMEQLKEAFMFFTKEKITILFEHKMIILGLNDAEDLATINSIDDLRIINEDNFFDFQNEIRECMGEKAAEMPDPTLHPKIKAMKAKARYRDRVKAKQGKGLDFNSSIASLCCMDMGLNPLNIGELSYAAVSVLIRYYQEKTKYETDIQCLLAGADSKKVHPVYWVRNIDNDD